MSELKATIQATGQLSGKVNAGGGGSGGIVDQTFNPTSANAQSGAAIAGELENYVEKVEGKGLSANDYTDSEKQKNADNASAITSLAQNKVSKVAGKDLSTNDYTDEEKQKNEQNATDIEEINTSLADYVKKTDYASASAAGVVRANTGHGISIGSSGNIMISRAVDTEIANRTEQYKPITPITLNTAVKAALTDSNRITGMTESEKANARDVIGAEQKTVIGSWSGSTMALMIPLSYNQTQICDHGITTLALVVSGAVPVGYECSFTFQSGETAATISYPGDSLKFVGVDCDADGDFVPSANTNYEVSIRNLSTNTANPLLVARVGVY